MGKTRKGKRSGGAPKPARKRRAPDPLERSPKTGETRAADAATIAWTLSATTVLLCDLAAACAYVAFAWRPAERQIFVLAEFLVLAGALVGLVTLVLTAVVYRVRRTPPPKGLTVFALCTAVAPMLAILARVFR